MKIYLLALSFFTASTIATAQEITQSLSSFAKIVASPKIDLILTEGDSESIRIVYANVEPDKIHVKVKNNTLSIYLDKSRMTEKQIRVSEHEKRSAYTDASITAYVTYKDLRYLEIRGNQELTCHSPLRANKFKLKAYGENEIRLTEVKAHYFKTQLYGENKLKIKGGRADYQKYKLYGENRIDTEALKSFHTVATIFGESKVKLSTQDELKVTAFGEAEVAYNGDANVHKGFVFGKTKIRKLEAN